MAGDSVAEAEVAANKLDNLLDSLQSDYSRTESAVAKTTYWCEILNNTGPQLAEFSSALVEVARLHNEAVTEAEAARKLLNDVMNGLMMGFGFLAMAPRLAGGAVSSAFSKVASKVGRELQPTGGGGAGDAPVPRYPTTIYTQGFPADVVVTANRRFDDLVAAMSAQLDPLWPEGLTGGPNPKPFQARNPQLLAYVARLDWADALPHLLSGGVTPQHPSTRPFFVHVELAHCALRAQWMPISRELRRENMGIHRNL